MFKLITSLFNEKLVLLIESTINLFTLVGLSLSNFIINIIVYESHLIEDYTHINDVNNRIAFYDGTYHQIRVRMNNVTAMD